MSEEVNSIINNLCEKLSVSAQSLIPELVKLRTAEAIFLTITFFVFVFVFVLLMPKAYELAKKDYLESPLYFCGAGAFIFGAFFLVSLYGLIGWLVSPTAKAVLEITKMIK